MKEQFAKNLLILDSREAILALAPLLETLAARCGQPAAMHWMPYFLDKAVLGRRLPRLVLLLNPEEQNEKSLQVEHLHAAALFFEYQLFGLRTGVVATGDAVGFNSIIAPAGERSRVAALASRALLDRGASICVATFDEEGNAGQARKSLGASRLRWAVRNRRVARMLPLKPTLDETLARMGKSTRFNLRYYRRRLEKQMRCDFYAEAGPLLREADLDGMNAASLNPVESGEFRRRITAASSLPGSFLCGLQGPDGKWLSLIGGWRQEQTTVLYWQMNASGPGKALYRHGDALVFSGERDRTRLPEAVDLRRNASQHESLVSRGRGGGPGGGASFAALQPAAASGPDVEDFRSAWPQFCM